MMASVTGVGWVKARSIGSGRDFKMVEPESGSLPKVTSRMVFGKVWPHFGRLDEYSKLGLAACSFALKDAGQHLWTAKRPIGVIASTVHGCLATDADYFETLMTYGGSLASPNLFALTLPNVFLGETAIHFGLTGPAFVINEERLTGLDGLRLALTTMAMGDCPSLLIGVCDPGRPKSLPLESDVRAGALFLFVEKEPADSSLSYGPLEMTRSEDILFRGSPVGSMEDILRGTVSGLPE